MKDTIEEQLEIILTRQNGLHGISHQVMGGKNLAFEYCPHCKEVVAALTLLIQQTNQIPTKYTADGKGWVHIDDVSLLITKARIDEASNALSAYNEWEEHRHNPSQDLKPGNLYLLDRIAQLKATTHTTGDKQ